MNEKDCTVEDKKMQRGIQRLQEMKASKKVGRVIFYLDGSEKVREVEAVEKI